MLQPSSIDVRLDRFFRVFENHRYPHIDPAADQSDLTRMVEPEGDEPFILHPGEFVLGSTYEVVSLPDDIAARVEGKSSLGRLGPADPRDRRLRGPRLLRARHARARQRRDPADQALPGHEDRPVLLLPALARRRSIRTARRSTARATRASAARPRRGRSRTSTGPRSDDLPTASPSPCSAAPVRRAAAWYAAGPRAGISVVIGSRAADRAAETAAELGRGDRRRRARAVQRGRGRCRGDVVVVAVPYDGHADLLRRWRTRWPARSSSTA